MKKAVRANDKYCTVINFGGAKINVCSGGRVVELDLNTVMFALCIVTSLP